MKEKITEEEIQGIDKVWHELIFSMQKTGAELWKDKLEGASTVEISILSMIERKPDAILKEIAEALGIPGSTLTSAVDRLEKRSLLKRVISKKDRRSFGLELTEEGRIAQQEHRKSEKVLWERVLGSYETSKERRELIRLLQILAKNVNGSMREGSRDGE
ncbi:MarR family winged helix-turn-helix transcriptional regulator [Clostridium sp. Marseille-P2415]|uniref:MarR family winged helix-turn-helix transcriptional regulator n=1 Tax=Clostridium sp. Marseille-P2415 TaxID=1805471 RepID=UPI0009886E76|nr:MarR family winged helix-turn-helix transcriptional regulator [Clostridium sp. Marseille-P2415]